MNPDGKLGEDEHGSRQPRNQRFRGPTMQDLRNQKRKK